MGLVLHVEVLELSIYTCTRVVRKRILEWYGFIPQECQVVTKLTAVLLVRRGDWMRRAFRAWPIKFHQYIIPFRTPTLPHSNIAALPRPKFIISRSRYHATLNSQALPPPSPPPPPSSHAFSHLSLLHDMVYPQGGVVPAQLNVLAHNNGFMNLHVCDGCTVLPCSRTKYASNQTRNSATATDAGLLVV